MSKRSNPGNQQEARESALLATYLWEKMISDAEFLSTSVGPEFHAACNQVAELAREQRQRAFALYKKSSDESGEFSAPSAGKKS